MAKLADICIINPRCPQFEDEFQVSFVPMQKVSETGTIDPSECREYAQVRKGFTYFCEGDVLFAKITPCMENGKGAVAAGLINGVGFGSTEFFVLRPDTTKIANTWLYYLTQWPQFRQDCERNMTGSAGQKRVPKAFLAGYPVRFPTLEEQEKQVAVLDRVNRLIGLREQQLKKLNELVKIRFVEMFGDPKTNPMGWKETTIGESCYYIKDGPHKSPPYVEHGIPFISTRNVVNGDGIDWSTAKYIAESDYEACIKKCKPEKGDILYSKGGTTGIAKYVDTDIKFANWVHVAVLKFGEELNGVFFQYMLNSDYCYEQSQALTKGVANRDLVLSAMAKIQFYLPPVSAQEEFVAFVQRVDRTKAEVKQSLESMELLKKSLMQQYFGNS